MLVNMITISYFKRGTNLSSYENIKNSLFERLLLLLFLCQTKNLLVLTVHHPLQTNERDDPTLWGRHVDFESICHQSSLLWIQSKNLHTFTIEPMISQGTRYIIVGLLKHFWVIIVISHESWYLKYWINVTPLSFLWLMYVLVCLFFFFENLFICLFLCNSLGLFVYFSNKLMQLGRKIFTQTL